MTVREEALMNESCITDDQLLVTPEEAARRLVGRTNDHLRVDGQLLSAARFEHRRGY